MHPEPHPSLPSTSRPTTDGPSTTGRTDPAHWSRRRFLTAALAVGGGATAVGYVLGTRLGATTPTASGSAAPSGAAGASAVPGSSVTAAPAASAPAAATTGADIFGDVTGEHMTITVANGVRSIRTASYPDWEIDRGFRYPGTPSPQSLEFQVTTTPAVAAQPTMVRTGQVFGVHRNSVVFDPATAEYYGGRDNRTSQWNENAPANRLDAHGAHTRPDGFYHLHMPTDAWVTDPTTHSAFVGWAADGFPIYLRYGYADPMDPTSGVQDLRSSYRLRSGARPSGSGSPGGTFDGTYVADYEYVEGLGDLDECNGRFCVTPEYGSTPTYAYFLTAQWPFVPHWIRGTPDPSFRPGFGGGSGGAAASSGRTTR